MLQLPDERPYRNIITKNLCVFATKTGHFTIRFLNRQIYRIFSPSRALSSNCVTLCCLDRCETSQLRQSYVTRHMSTAPQIPYMGLHRKTTASLPEIGPFVGGAMDAQVRFIVPRGGVGISAND